MTPTHPDNNNLAMPTKDGCNDPSKKIISVNADDVPNMATTQVSDDTPAADGKTTVPVHDVLFEHRLDADADADADTNADADMYVIYEGSKTAVQTFLESNGFRSTATQKVTMVDASLMQALMTSTLRQGDQAHKRSISWRVQFET